MPSSKNPYPSRTPEYAKWYREHHKEKIAKQRKEYAARTKNDPKYKAMRRYSKNRYKTNSFIQEAHEPDLRELYNIIVQRMERKDI